MAHLHEDDVGYGGPGEPSATLRASASTVRPDDSWSRDSPWAATPAPQAATATSQQDQVKEETQLEATIPSVPVFGRQIVGPVKTLSSSSSSDRSDVEIIDAAVLSDSHAPPPPATLPTSTPPAIATPAEAPPAQAPGGWGGRGGGYPPVHRLPPARPVRVGTSSDPRGLRGGGRRRAEDSGRGVRAQRDSNIEEQCWVFRRRQQQD